MELRQLRYFVAVADAGSLAQAARSLFVTQPTLTVALQKLESELRAPLFQHGTESRYELTAAGRLLYDEGAQLLERLDSLSERIRSLDDDDERTPIRVGLTVLFAMQFMRSIAQYIATHRHVEVTLIQGGSRELQTALAAGDIDVGLLSFPISERDINIEPLPARQGSYDVAVVMKATNPLADRAAVSFADLRGQRFCSFSDKFVLGDILRSRCAQAGYDPDVAFTNDNWEVLLTAVESLDGVCLIPAPFRELSTLPGLAWVPLQDKANTFPIGIATHRTRERARAVDEFIATIRKGA